MSKRKQPSITMDAKENVTTACVFVSIGEGATVPTEEVIRYLESGGLRLRTRKKVSYIVAKVCEKGCAFSVHFKCSLDWTFREDILNALRKFFSTKGYEACAA